MTGQQHIGVHPWNAPPQIANYQPPTQPEVRTLTVYDEPVAKARPRVTVRAGRAHAYTPAATLQAEWRIRNRWIETHGTEPMTGPLALTVTVWLAIPQSMPKKHRATAQPTKRPDLDNYIKTVMDALNGVAWADDSQVVRIIADKRYIKDATLPRWEIAVEALG